jgi:hypothetical protein
MLLDANKRSQAICSWRRHGTSCHQLAANQGCGVGVGVGVGVVDSELEGIFRWSRSRQKYTDSDPDLSLKY